VFCELLQFLRISGRKIASESREPAFPAIVRVLSEDTQDSGVFSKERRTEATFCSTVLLKGNVAKEPIPIGLFLRERLHRPESESRFAVKTTG
jgi:hypothetical protein